MGEILVLEFRDGANRYDASIPTSHPHLFCTRCRRLEDRTVGDLESLATEVAAKTGYSIKRHRLEFHGLGPACRAAAVD